MGNLLWTVIVILIVLWFIGILTDIFGGLVHFILVIAGIIFIVQLITGRRA